MIASQGTLIFQRVSERHLTNQRRVVSLKNNIRYILWARWSWALRRTKTIKFNPPLAVELGTERMMKTVLIKSTLYDTRLLAEERILTKGKNIYTHRESAKKDGITHLGQIIMRNIKKIVRKKILRYFIWVESRFELMDGELDVTQKKGAKN